MTSFGNNIRQDNTEVLPKSVEEQAISKKSMPDLVQKRAVVDDSVVNRLLEAQKKKQRENIHTDTR